MTLFKEKRKTIKSVKITNSTNYFSNWAIFRSYSRLGCYPKILLIISGVQLFTGCTVQCTTFLLPNQQHKLHKINHKMKMNTNTQQNDNTTLCQSSLARTSVIISQTLIDTTDCLQQRFTLILDQLSTYNHSCYNVH